MKNSFIVFIMGFCWIITEKKRNEGEVGEGEEEEQEECKVHSSFLLNIIW